MRQLATCRIPFLSPAGDLVAHVEIAATRSESKEELAPIVQITEAEAREYGESEIQLRESERYEYEVLAADDSFLSLKCDRPHSVCWRSRRNHARDTGFLETRSFCGTLQLELVRDEEESSQAPVATALIDVRSLKLDYRTEYRGMLRMLADELAGLIADARSSTKAGFISNFEHRDDAGWMQIQLELLKEVLDSHDFSGALQRILSFPHERLSPVHDTVNVDRPIRWTPHAIRQLVVASPRREVPSHHSLKTRVGLQSVAERVVVPRKSRDLDTAENRFVKFALIEFRSFLDHAQSVFDADKEWQASSKTCRRLSATLDDWLGRGFFKEINNLRFVPLGSPVLQRKGGYRELLRWWLRFKTAAELSWGGGEDLFRAGQRDVASLYEYWLFFQLLTWFSNRCGGGNRPPIEDLIEGLEEGRPNLRLRKRVQLGPFSGKFTGQNRNLQVRFAYNRRFELSQERGAAGSWTRRFHPDYTFSFWPEGLSESAAEEQELLVHIHFDAKYRVEDLESLFGAEDAEDDDEELDGNYKSQDLLKMHAYRDAIKRSQGAYVLYPGRNNAPERFQGFHEILPGLGAFGVSPDSEGAPKGFEVLGNFLEEILLYLSNRTTAQERLSYHVAESYRLKEEPVPYGGLKLPEADFHAPALRAPPPAEQMVLAAWYQNEAQLELARKSEGFVFVRLGRRRGALHVHPNLSKTMYVLMRTSGPSAAPGLLALREPGFRIFTRSQLRDELTAHKLAGDVAPWQPNETSGDEDFIYALFRTKQDPAFNGQTWDDEKVMLLIERFESDLRNKPVENVGRASPYPRLLPLQDLLKARAEP
jgi:predicted component of viral defense system (DUF524 family)